MNARHADLGSQCCQPLDSRSLHTARYDSPRALRVRSVPKWRTMITKNRRWALLAILLWAAVGEDCAGQFRVPIPRIPVVPHVPIPHHVPVHLPSFHRGFNDQPDHRNDSAQPETSSWFSDWAMVAVVLVGLGGLAVFPFFAGKKNRRMAPRIRIIAVPPGEAPESVRRAWVGLALSLPPGETGLPRMLPAEGVLSGHAAGSCLGFLVEGKEAITALSLHDSLAAAWWRENVPEISAERYRLGFPASVCEVERVGGPRNVNGRTVPWGARQAAIVRVPARPDFRSVLEMLGRHRRNGWPIGVCHTRQAVGTLDELSPVSRCPARRRVGPPQVNSCSWNDAIGMFELKTPAPDRARQSAGLYAAID